MKLIYSKMQFGFVLLMCITAVPISLAKKMTRTEEILQNPNDALNPALSTPEECTRVCNDNEPPKICYYHFTLEMYTVGGGACSLCSPNATNQLVSECQCVLADGVERGILTANRMMPGPSIQVCEGDKVVIDVANHLHGMEVTIHWHGLWQNGFQYYDGVPSLTQCAILEGTTFRYQWTAANAGTHFWHSHTGSQKIDGLHGSVIVRQVPTNDLNSDLYDFDLPTHVVHINDWMHEDSSQRFPGLLKGKTGQAAENVLINGKGQFTDPNTGVTTDTPLEVFTITSGRRYRFRLINSFATVCPGIIVFEKHSLTVIATDGEPVAAVSVNSIVSFSGERYDFVIDANQASDAYWIQLRGLGECGIKRVQNLAILRYEDGPHKPTTAPPTYDNGIPEGVILNPLDGDCYQPRKNAICVNQLRSLKAIDVGLLQEHADFQIYLPYEFLYYTPEQLFKINTYKNYLVNEGYLVSLVDGISFELPSAPPLSQIEDISPEQFCNRKHKPATCGDTCSCTHQYDIPLGAIVEVILFDDVPAPNLSHPFHLHGYAFNVIGMGRLPEMNETKQSNLEKAIDMDRKGLLNRTYNFPPGKDTIAVPNNGYTIVRLRANNPGYWIFHCHFTFHLAIGMSMVLHVGTQEDLPPIPPNFPKCGNHLPPIVPP